ncbi:MAG: cyclic nucleotide-binding domain-containing protein [Bdellovibrionia bacterium]
MSTQKPSISLLKEIKLLQPLTDSELTQVLQLGRWIKYEPHSNIVIEGELSWGLYLIVEGMVGIFKTNKLTGENYDIGQLRKGSFFGEMSLVDNNPRSATVKALTECDLFFVSKEAFQALLNHSPATKVRFYESCVKHLVARLRELDDNYVISQYQLWKIALKKEAA